MSRNYDDGDHYPELFPYVPQTGGMTGTSLRPREDEFRKICFCPMWCRCRPLPMARKDMADIICKSEEAKPLVLR